MKYSKILIPAALVLTLLSACGSGDKAVQTPQPEPTVNVPVVQESTPTIQESAPATTETEPPAAAEPAQTVPIAETTQISAPVTIDGTVTDTSFEVTWDAVSGADAYRIYFYEPSVDDFLAAYETTDCAFSIWNLSPGTTYLFKIAVLANSGGEYTEKAISDVFYAVTSGGNDASSVGGGTHLCNVCYGSGVCRSCDGTGYSWGEVAHYRPVCGSCHGSGRCVACNGTGYY